MTEECIRPVCTRVRINRDRDTEISLSNDRGIVRANVVLTDIEGERRKRGRGERKKERKEESYSSIVRGLYFSLWPREKYARYIRTGNASRNLNSRFER